MLQAFLLPMLPVVLIAALGAVLSRRTEWLNNPSLGTLVTNIGLPALLIHSLLKMDVDLAGMGELLAAMASALALIAMITWLVLRLTGQSVRDYLAVLTNPNTGNLGIPVVYALLGEDALAPAVVISSVVTISHFTLGVSVMSGSFKPKELVKNMPAIALMVSALLIGFQVELPAFAMRTLDLLGGLTLPVMLLLLGRSLGNLKLGHTTRWGRLLAMAIYRPVVGVLVAFLITRLFAMGEIEGLVLMIQCAMPTAVISYILATRYQGPVDDVAALIILSLPFSLITVALLNTLFVSA
ncbi:MAG: AEC family transporter [Oceanospirillales bacterium]|nr:AEC family transporter [Oceanospirillales bacterium]